VKNCFERILLIPTVSKCRLKFLSRSRGKRERSRGNANDTLCGETLSVNSSFFNGLEIKVSFKIAFHPLRQYATLSICQ
jgi:hypothetical protein